MPESSEIEKKPCVSKATVRAQSNAEGQARPKRVYRKVALLVGYLGAGYHGVQIQNNSNFKTIESELFSALADCGAIPEENAFDPKRMQFQRCSRTDKNVSAVRQVFSLKINITPTIISSINSCLPETIRIFGLKRVTKKFNCYRLCSHRVYEYIIPTYVFSQSINPDVNNYRLNAHQKEIIKDVCAIFVGTRDYYNFTSNRGQDVRPVLRYNMKFQPSEYLEYEGVEFVKFFIQGQSFMLHQIRYMIGFVIMVLRGIVKPTVVESIFAVRDIRLIKAPGLGLMLENVVYDHYNTRFKDDATHPPLQWDDQRQATEDFKENVIVKHILETEVNELFTLNWVRKVMNPDSEHWFGLFCPPEKFENLTSTIT